MNKEKIIHYCSSLGLDTVGFIKCRTFHELKDFYQYRKDNNLENEFEESEIEKRINPKVYMETIIITLDILDYFMEVNENKQRNYLKPILRIQIKGIVFPLH